MSECGSCGAAVAPGQRFCGGCGSALTSVCAACGASAAPDQRFCVECGSPLGDTGPSLSEAPVGPSPSPAPVDDAAELRVVSVLFCDLVGHTPRSEQLDADEVRELLSGYFDVAREVIGRHGGTIEKFIGDAVMAVWGVPVAGEHDAERAVRAGLELVDAVTAYGERHHTDGLAARVGIVTGRAAAVTAVDEGIVVGDRVNTAARIQSIAEPGSVLVDDTTREATRAVIAYGDGGLHALKGKVEPVQVWRAERAIAGALGVNRGSGVEAEMVGRDRELRLLKELFHECVDRRTARLVSIVGAAGVGKSRLLWEFDKYVDGLVATTKWHQGRCLSYGDGVAFWALAQMVRHRLGIGEQDSSDDVRRRLADGLAGWEPADREFVEPRLALLLGVGDTSASRDELFGAWRVFFERMAGEAAVVLVVEDVQWADDGLLDFLDSLLAWSAQFPIFVVTSSRPELLDRRPGWGHGRHATTIALEPLDAPSMRRLLDDLVDLPPVSVDRVVAKAEGIPLFAVEIARSVLDRGDFDDLVVPASLTALLAARFDALPPDERSLVRDMAVFGTTFPRAAIEAVATPTATPLEVMLSSLLRHEILSVVADPLSPERGQLQFTHGLMRAVVYDNLTRRDRKARHVAVAGHLRRAFADDGAEVAEVIADHYRQALDAASDDDEIATLRVEASAAYRRAGDRAAGLGAPGVAAKAYLTAIELTDDPPTRTELRRQAGVAAGFAGQCDTAVSLLEQAIADLDAAGRHDDARLAIDELSSALQDAGRMSEQQTLLESALATAGDAADRGTGAVILALATSQVIDAQDGGEDTRRLIDRSIAIAEGLGDRHLLARALNIEGIRHLFLDNPITARIQLAGAVELARPLGELRLLSIVLANYGQVLTGDDEAADDVLAESTALALRLGRAATIAVMIGNHMRSLILRGDWDGAEAIGATARNLDLATFSGEPQRWLAVLAAFRGDHTSARRLLDEWPPWDDPEDRALAECQDVILRHTAGVFDDLAAHTRELLERQIADYGWRFDTISFLWSIGVDTALKAGELELADQLVERLVREAPARRPPHLAAELLRTQGRLAVARGQQADVEGLLRESIDRLEQIPRPVPAGHARLDLRDWLAAHGRNDEASQIAEPAVATARRLGAIALLERLDVSVVPAT